jgi:hypothetical protein
MIDEQFENLAKRWPDLFHKSGNFEFSVGEGWYNIIDLLCGFLSTDVEQTKRRLKYAMENSAAVLTESIDVLEEKLAKSLEDLPTIVQVKEKFGSLRFYINGGTPEMYNYISFAEAMSGRTCEVCGAPGKSRNNGWIKVLCNKHHIALESPDTVGYYPRQNSEVKLSDEETE